MPTRCVDTVIFPTVKIVYTHRFAKSAFLFCFFLYSVSYRNHIKMRRRRSIKNLSIIQAFCKHLFFKQVYTTLSYTLLALVFVFGIASRTYFHFSSLTSKPHPTSFKSITCPIHPSILAVCLNPRFVYVLLPFCFSPFVQPVLNRSPLCRVVSFFHFRFFPYFSLSFSLTHPTYFLFFIAQHTTTHSQPASQLAIFNLATHIRKTQFGKIKFLLLLRCTFLL